MSSLHLRTSLLGLLLAGCVSTYACPYNDTDDYSVRADLACPSPASIQQQVSDGTDHILDLAAMTTDHAAETVCWYLILESDAAMGCDLNDRAGDLRNATSDVTQVFIPDDVEISCEAGNEPELYGIVQPTGDCAAVPDPRDVLLGFGLGSLVGRDDYPARNTCSYDRHVDAVCSSGGGGENPWGAL